ncbi:uncharacterized protein KY384_003028 [Bacidia gigantensis]|uniref:uncharacterized protein n=1 Tax=Bacidia gigantensis TaxID=2732470 RepID=UPI001D04DDCC|nr:uncharacterized protein KY384_003028 [Bacidia gigantensis]KAG8531399.1 hypothetical protein KY384_003028 [Bacidia gigantensis]
MAQKATKVLAARNGNSLNRTHLISLVIHAFYLLLRLLFFYKSFTLRSLLLYVSFAGPSFVIEFWLERIGRPVYTSDGGVQKAGEDLEQKGLTEYLWDVLYWTWACVALATIFGDRSWWAYTAVPLYSAYLAWKTYSGMKGGLGMGSGEENGQPSESKRQKKMEKRGQKVQYR